MDNLNTTYRQKRCGNRAFVRPDAAGGVYLLLLQSFKDAAGHRRQRCYMEFYANAGFSCGVNQKYCASSARLFMNITSCCKDILIGSERTTLIMSFKSNALLEFMWTPSKPYHRYILWLSMDKSQEWTNSKHAVLRRGRSGHNKSVFKEVDRFMFFFCFFYSCGNV